MSATRFILLFAVALTTACTQHPTPQASAPQLCESHGGVIQLSSQRNARGQLEIRHICGDGSEHQDPVSAPAPAVGVRGGAAG